MTVLDQIGKVLVLCFYSLKLTSGDTNCSDKAGFFSLYLMWDFPDSHFHKANHSFVPFDNNNSLNCISLILKVPKKVVASLMIHLVKRWAPQSESCTPSHFSTVFKPRGKEQNSPQRCWGLFTQSLKTSYFHKMHLAITYIYLISTYLIMFKQMSASIDLEILYFLYFKIHS